MHGQVSARFQCWGSLKVDLPSSPDCRHWYQESHFGTSSPTSLILVAVVHVLLDSRLLESLRPITASFLCSFFFQL